VRAQGRCCCKGLSTREQGLLLLPQTRLLTPPWRHSAAFAARGEPTGDAIRLTSLRTAGCPEARRAPSEYDGVACERTVQGGACHHSFARWSLASRLGLPGLALPVIGRSAAFSAAATTSGSQPKARRVARGKAIKYALQHRRASRLARSAGRPTTALFDFCSDVNGLRCANCASELNADNEITACSPSVIE
jgi:hypothetical protein